jgi:hypothetical protein
LQKSFFGGTFSIVEHLILTKGKLLPKNKPKNAMKNMSPSSFIILTRAATRILLGCLLTVGITTLVHAQGQIASGTIGSSGSGPYTYSLTFSDAAGATSPIGSVWYSWIPGQFYLPGVPTSASAPAGWTATVQSDSVQYVASSPANYITAGHSLSGFGYQATFTPAQLAAAPNSGVSDAYSAGLFSDSGDIFTVQAVPEPAAQALMVSGAAALALIGRRKLRTN